jgi:DNA-binding transcriptional LysR family regulator
MAQQLANRLTVKHLRLIAAIARHGQLSLAAESLALTQPAASRTLGEIEALCGGVIFDRHARGMTLTPLGELLERRARNVLEEIGEASQEVARYRSGRGGTVRIGAVTGGAIGYVVPVVQRFRREAPDTEIHVEVAMSSELVRDLLAMRLDFVLARIPADASAGDFEAVRASGEQVDLVVGAHHPAARQPKVALAELVDFDWVLQGPGAPLPMALEAAARIVNTSSLLVTIAMLATSEAVAPVSREVATLIAGTRSAIAALALRERIVVAPYSLLALRGRRLSPAGQRCHEMMAEALAAGRG